MRALATLLSALLFTLISAQGEVMTLTGLVRDNSGDPVADILVHARSGDEPKQVVVSGRTREDGSYALTVPDDERNWNVVTDEIELFERGFFCEPGFIWEPGEVVIIPELTTVPLTPKLTLIRSDENVTCIQLDFEWLSGVTPEVLRQYKIERSQDMRVWEEVLTVALGCPPMSVFDETQTGAECGYYRVVPVESVTIIVLEEEEWEFLADPMFGWEGDPALVFDPDEPLPGTPVMAPVIFIRPDSTE